MFIRLCVCVCVRVRVHVRVCVRACVRACMRAYMCVSVCAYVCTYRGIDLDGNTVGIAFLNTMCDKARSVGLSQDGRSLSGVVTTAAHELGHIFNMKHDDGNV